GGGCLVYVGEARPEDRWLWELGSLAIVPVATGPSGRAEPFHGDPGAALADPLPDDPAYIFFTSGTTGRPKAVLGRQKGLSHFLTWQRETWGVGPGDRIAQLTGLSFDAVLRDIFLSLTSGATLHLPDEDDLSPERLLPWLAERAITVLHTVPSVGSAWLGGAAPGFGSESLRWTFFVGEPLLGQVVERWRAAFSRTEIVNLYGATETTLAKCFYSVPDPPILHVQPAGLPMPQSQALVLAGERLCGIGEVGEIVLRTPFRSLGYLNNPAENRVRFRPNPFPKGAKGAEDLLYFTGDRGRYRCDGTLEILGRLDEQVKIRGVRIEPAEIRVRLGHHDAVWESAVVAREIQPLDLRLVAYVVLRPGAVFDPESLRRHLRQELPEVMVPTAFVALDALPLTPNGKLDARALPVPAWSSGEQRTLGTPVEEILSAIWSEVLEVERVGAYDNFFDLGGHSLLATRVISQVRSTFQVELRLHELFEAPTVEGLALRIEAAVRSGAGPAAPPIGPVPRAAADLPLSFAQQRLWFIDQLEGGALYNMPISLRMSGQLSVAVLSRVLGEVARRHEVLRTVFSAAGGVARQIIRPPVSPAGFEIPLVDLTQLSPGLREPVAAGWISAEARRPFDLGRGPLLRARLWRLGETEHVLLVALHHIVSDGWSLGVLVREVTALYTAFSSGQPSPLAELPVQYADFAAWQRSWLSGGVLEGELAYWRQRLSGAPPVLELPLDRPRPAVQSFSGAVRHLSLPPELSGALVALSRRQGATLFMTLLAVWEVLLSRLTGQMDLTVGTGVAGRNRREIEDLIGFFVNTLVLRTDLSGDPRFTVLLSRVRREALDAYAHQDLPFEKLVEELAPERSLAHTPLFQVMLVLQNLGLGELALPGLRLVSEGHFEDVAKFDLHLSFDEAGGRIDGALSYARDLFDAPTIDRLAAHFAVLLAAVVERPELPVSRLSLLAPGERHQLTVEWNATSSRLPPGGTLPELFAIQATAHPRRLAWELGGEELCYEDLAGRSTAVAGFLRRQGVGAGDLVGLCVERSGAMLVAMLGILKAGAAYLPLDPNYPRERLSWMLEDSGAPLLLTQENLAPRLPPTRARVVRLDSQWGDIEGIRGTGEETVAGSPASSATAATAATAESLAYVIYTSGSTGRPKGVAVPHRAVVRLVMATDYVDLGGAERMAQLSNISFDAATFEIWGALLHGATLVGVPQETLLSPADLAAFLEAARIRVLFLTTALFNQVAQQAPGAFTAMHDVLFGGEAVDPGAVRKVLASGAPKRLLHVYGPTENTTFSTWYRVETVPATAVTVPIGRPIANTRAYLLDSGLQPVPLGGVGELYLAGEGLAREYWRQPELTGERFVESPALPGERLYRTGDLARWLPDGNLLFRGRDDHQIKLRGFRIELEEIELALKAAGGIAEAVVVVRQDLAGGRGLVAYIVRGVGAHPSSAALRQALKEQLPDYMVPAHFVPMAALPLTPNGKVDRQWLAERGPLSQALAAAASWVAPGTPVEELLAGIFAEVLAIERVGAEADFFALGGHSLLATQLISRVRAAFRVELPLRAVFEQPTVAGLAHEIEKASSPGVTAPPLERVDRGAELPLSFAQQRLWFLSQLDPESSAYNISLSLLLAGHLEVATLEAALSAVVRRHEALRTRFPVQEGRPVQVIDGAAWQNLPVVDLRGLPSAAHSLELQRLGAEAVGRPFDLSRGPLLRATLLRLEDESWVALFVLHHIVSDGWSIGVLAGEVSAYYRAQQTGGDPGLSELPIQYADFASWQRSWLSGPVLESEIGHWRRRLQGVAPLLDLPLDRPRPPVQSFRGAVRSFVLREALVEGLRTLCRGSGATLFMALLSAFQALLSHLTGQEDFAVGTPVAGRNRLEIEGLIGFFVNTLVLRADVSGNPGGGELLRRNRKETLDVYAHQDLPFEKLVEELAPERSLSHAPLCQAVLALQNLPAHDLAIPGVASTLIDFGVNTSKFDLMLTLEEIEGCLAGTMTYATDLFDGTTIERWIGQLEAVLAAYVEDVEVAVADLPLLSAVERHQLVREWSGYVDEERGTIRGLFEAQVDRRPEAVAVVWAGEELTYGELDQLGNRLAHHLRALGVGPEVPVGLCA
ncbi:MAG: amino acid adenylation domain-containing protein, partial [Acidobacteriota bacterium]|nr:amino acid adenylation domain-containing protein [Acidobacteriota bacterium]